MNEKCHKCGSVLIRHASYSSPRVAFACGSTRCYEGRFYQTDKCQKMQLSIALWLIEKLAYSIINPDALCADYIAQAEAMIGKKINPEE